MYALNFPVPVLPYLVRMCWHTVIPAAFAFRDLSARKSSPEEWYRDTFKYTGRDVEYSQAFAAVWSNRGESLKWRLWRELSLLMYHGRTRQALKPSCLLRNNRNELHNQQLWSIRGDARWKPLNCFAFQFVLKIWFKLCVYNPFGVLQICMCVYIYICVYICVYIYMHIN